MRLTRWCCLLTLAACATQPGAGEPASSSTASGTATGGDASVAAATGAAGATATEASADIAGGAAGVVAAIAAPQSPGRRFDLWSMPDFRRRFAESYMAVTDVEPGVDLDEQEVLLEVFDLIQADRLDDAEKLLRRKMEGTSSAVFDFTLGNIRFQRDDLDTATAAYRAAIDKFANFRRAWQALGQIHFTRERFSEAVIAFTRVLELGGGNATTYGLLGVAEMRLEQFIAAESAFRMASLLAPESMDWKFGLADAFFKQQRFGEAIALFGTLIAEQPDRVEFWLAQGEAYARTEQPMKAAENFEMVERLGAATAVTLYNLGDIYANGEVFELAVDAYLRALDAGPDEPVDRAVRAAKFITAKGGLQASRRLIQGLESRRGDSLAEDVRKDLLKMRARIAVAEGAGDEEAAVLGQIIELDPLDGDALILLGQHFARKGEPEQAGFHYERAAAIEGYEADAKVRHAQLLVGEGRYNEAVPLLKQAQAVKPRENIQQYLEQVERAARRGS